MRDILLNYHKYIALPACMALLFGMPLVAQSADDGTSMAEEKYKQGDEYKKETGQASGHTEIDAGTKQKFVSAYIEIKDIQNKYSEKLNNVDDKNKAQELQKQAQSEMVKVVKNNGMTVNEYNQVVSAISSDPELRTEIEQMAQKQAE